jgi:hypothetical protein
MELPERWAGREGVLAEYYLKSSILLMPTINFWTYQLSILETFEGVLPRIAS